MKYLLIFLFFLTSAIADTKKVYFYTTETNINNFKTLKVSFDTYLQEYGDYEFQPFNDKKTFEGHLEDEDSLVILSSWHYKKISKKYNLKAKLIAQKKGSITDTKILVGQKGISFEGRVTSAYDAEYSRELLRSFTRKEIDDFSILIVPKEIDALMSVGFGMSKFALVSKDSFSILKTINPFLAKNLQVYKESKMKYRMVLAHKKIDTSRDKLMKIFQDMEKNIQGRKVLNLIGIDSLLVLNTYDLRKIGGVR